MSCVDAADYPHRKEQYLKDRWAVRCWRKNR